jgi:hypothetical protein
MSVVLQTGQHTKSQYSKYRMIPLPWIVLFIIYKTLSKITNTDDQGKEIFSITGWPLVRGGQEAGAENKLGKEYVFYDQGGEVFEQYILV